MELDRTLSRDGQDYPFAGTYDPRFEKVVDAFLENYRVDHLLEAGIVGPGEGIVLPIAAKRAVQLHGRSSGVVLLRRPLGAGGGVVKLAASRRAVGEG